MISYEAILKKMEEKAGEARLQKDERKIRETVEAIKTLCELILEDKKGEIPPGTAPGGERPVQTTVYHQEKLETDDGANGDSLLDF